MVDGATTEGESVADELVSIGESTFADKVVGDKALVVIANWLGPPKRCVTYAGEDIISL